MITLQELVHSVRPPEAWNRDKLHRVLRVIRARRNLGLTEINLLSLSYGRIVRRDIDTAEGLLPESFESYQIVEPGNIVLRLTDLQNDKRSLRQGLVRERGIITSAYDALEVRMGHDARYWFYVLFALDTAKYYYSLGGGVRQSIKFADFPNDWIAVPDCAIQRQIAEFLDREIAQIDLLIHKKQSLLKVLTRKEVLLRDNAVLRGLRRSRLKASGVEWFGEVPESWTVCRFNRLVSLKVDYRGRTPEKVDDGVFLVTARNIRNGRIDYERSQEYTTQADWDALSARGKPELGDVIFTTEAPLGQVAQVDRTDVAFAQRIIKFRANNALATNDFLAELLMTSAFQRSLQLYASGSTAAGIKSERLSHLFGVAPPIDEQGEIVHTVRSGVTALRELARPISTSVDRLREYRSALITAAVTGQIDLATWRRSGEGDRRLEIIQETLLA